MRSWPSRLGIVERYYQERAIRRIAEAFEHQHEEQQCDGDVYRKRMEAAGKLGEFGSLLAVGRSVDQQDR